MRSIEVGEQLFDQYFDEINAAPVVFRWNYKMDEIVIGASCKIPDRI